MKHAIAITLTAAVLCAAGIAHAGPSNLTDRYGLGFGWGYISGVGLPTVTGNTVVNGSLLDAPKILTTKIGLGQNLAIEPSFALAFIKYDDKISKMSPFLLRLAPLLDYAVFQKEKVNFYLKGGLAVSYAKELSTSRYSDIIFTVPVGFGIEWWMLENLAFDASAITDFIAFDMGKATSKGDTMTTFGMSLSNLMATLSLIFWF